MAIPATVQRQLGTGEPAGLLGVLHGWSSVVCFWTMFYSLSPPEGIDHNGNTGWRVWPFVVLTDHKNLANLRSAKWLKLMAGEVGTFPRLFGLGTEVLASVRERAGLDPDAEHTVTLAAGLEG